MTSASHKSTQRTGAAPAKLRRQISTGAEVDYSALLDWWTGSCPEHLKDAGLSPLTAALLSVVPGNTARELPGRLRFTMSPHD